MHPKIIATFIVLICALSCAFGAVSFEQLPANSKFPDRCVFIRGDPPSQYVLKDGETQTAPIGVCLSYSCSKSEEGFFLSSASCGVVTAGSGCHVSDIDTTKVHPDCCPRLVC